MHPCARALKDKEIGSTAVGASLQREVNGRWACKCGRFLLEMPKNKGASEAGWKTQLHDATTLQNLGIKKDQSVRLQCMALVPEEERRAYYARQASGKLSEASAGASQGERTDLSPIGEKLSQDRAAQMFDSALAPASAPVIEAPGNRP